MSVRTMARVWANSQHRGTELLMLLAIADFADDDGNAYPAVATLAEKCRMTDRNANHLLANLRASGELEIRHNEGPSGTNRYRIVLPAVEGMKQASPPKGPRPLKQASPPGAEVHFTPEAGFTLKPVAQTPEVGFIPPLKPTSDEPSLNHQEPSKGARGRSAGPECPADVDPKVWADWLTLRKAKKAPVTETVMRSARGEASKAGMTFEAFLTVWCNRGSQGLEASWIKPADRSPLGRSPMDSDHVYGSAT